MNFQLTSQYFQFQTTTHNLLRVLSSFRRPLLASDTLRTGQESYPGSGSSLGPLNPFWRWHHGWTKQKFDKSDESPQYVGDHVVDLDPLVRDEPDKGDVDIAPSVIGFPVAISREDSGERTGTAPEPVGP